MHAKAEQIQAFIDTDLTEQIDQALASGGEDKVAELKATYKQARTQAVEFGITDPDNNPRVKDAKGAQNTNVSKLSKFIDINSIHVDETKDICLMSGKSNEFESYPQNQN